MSTLSKERRQEIVRDFCERHDGRYDPARFLEEVRLRGKAHPAHAWFEWDTKRAALAYQLDQARDFARDLRVTFRVEAVGRSSSVRVVEASMPLVMSPLEGRSHGGGYLLVDPEDPDHQAAFCQEAAHALRSWANRYEAALRRAGAPTQEVERLIVRLERVGLIKVPPVAAE